MTRLDAGQERMLVLIFTLMVGAGFLLPLTLFEYDWPSEMRYLWNTAYAIAAHGVLLLAIVEALRRWPTVRSQLVVTYVLATVLFLAVWFTIVYEPYLGSHIPIDTSEGIWDPEAVAAHDECLNIVRAQPDFTTPTGDLRQMVEAMNAAYIRCDRALLETLEEP